MEILMARTPGFILNSVGAYRKKKIVGWNFWSCEIYEAPEKMH